MTVAHINATAKNAADDKLRQSLRRFADTHTAPATVVLVSSKSLWYSATVLASVPLIYYFYIWHYLDFQGWCLEPALTQLLKNS